MIKFETKNMLEVCELISAIDQRLSYNKKLADDDFPNTLAIEAITNLRNQLRKQYAYMYDECQNCSKLSEHGIICTKNTGCSQSSP